MLGVAAAGACTPRRTPTGRAPSPSAPGSPRVTAPAASTPPTLDTLAGLLGPRLLRPADAGYATAAQLYSPKFDAVHPQAVARCASVADVQHCLSFARTTGTPLAVRGGGHSYAGYSTTTGIVIDVSAMNAIGPGSKPGTARIEAGAQLVDVYAGLAATGVSIPGGSCPTVGIAGSTLGGGVGVVSRRYGLSCDALTAVELVLADGTPVRCDDSHDADLFWAQRGGGGGNFGVATAFEFATHPAGSLTRFVVRWRWADADRAVDGWQQWLPSAPNAVWSSLHLDGAGSLGASPQVYASGVFVGAPAGLQPVLDALQEAGAGFTERYVQQAGYLETMLVEGGCAGLSIAACHASSQPGGTLPRESNAARSDYIDAPLPAAGIDVLLDGVERRSTALRLPGGAVVFDGYGGAINAVGAGDTAFVHRNALACLQYVAPEATPTATNQAWLDGLYTAMRPHVSGYAYQNYIDAGLTDWQHAYYGSNLARLVGVKRSYDPTDVFRFAQGIPT